MTDLERFVSLLGLGGIEHSVTTPDFEPTVVGRPDWKGTSVWLEVGAENVDGYGGFFARFLFDESGRLTGVVIAE